MQGLERELQEGREEKIGLDKKLDAMTEVLTRRLGGLML